jgi:hypothetical protein
MLKAVESFRDWDRGCRLMLTEGIIGVAIPPDVLRLFRSVGPSIFDLA